MSATTSRSSAVAKLVSRLVLGSFVTVLLVLPNVGDRTSPKASAVVPCATTTTVDPLVTTTTDPLATTTTVDPLATTTTTIDPCATTTTTTAAPTTTAAATTTTASVTTTTSGAVIPLVPTTTVDPASITTTIDPAATTTTVAPTTTVVASVSSTTVVSATTPTLAFDAPPETTRPIQQLTPETTVAPTTTTTIVGATSTTVGATTTVPDPSGSTPNGPSAPGGVEPPIGTREVVKTVWTDDPTASTPDQQQENLGVASYIVKDLLINSNQPMPTTPVGVDGRLILTGSPNKVQGTVTGTSSGYLPGATGHLYAASQPVHLGAFTADAQGVIHFDVTLPSKLTGPHHLVMVGNDATGNLKASVLPITVLATTNSGPGSATATGVSTGGSSTGGASVAPAVDASSDPNQMAMTGADVFGLVFAAMTFIVAGTLTAYRTRKVRANP